MLTTGDALAKTLAKSQKVTFWSKKIALEHLQQLAKKKASKAIFLAPKSYFLRFS